jgi:hypothetical protein
MSFFELAWRTSDSPHGHDKRNVRLSTLMNENKTKCGGEVCVKNANGTYSADAIHEQMTAGVDDSDIRARTRDKLHARGIPAAALNGLFPDLPPLPAD